MAVAFTNKGGIHITVSLQYCPTKSMNVDCGVNLPVWCQPITVILYDLKFRSFQEICADFLKQG